MSNATNGTNWERAFANLVNCITQEIKETRDEEKANADGEGYTAFLGGMAYGLGQALAYARNCAGEEAYEGIEIHDLFPNEDFRDFE